MTTRFLGVRRDGQHHGGRSGGGGGGGGQGGGGEGEDDGGGEGGASGGASSPRGCMGPSRRGDYGRGGGCRDVHTIHCLSHVMKSSC